MLELERLGQRWGCLTAIAVSVLLWGLIMWIAT